MTKKSTSVSLLIFGILFISLGAFLFSSQSGAAEVAVVAALDVLFGIALIIGAVRSLKSHSVESALERVAYEAEDDSELLTEQPEYQSVQSESPAQSVEEYFGREKLSENLVDATVERADLAARESELRAEAKRAAEEAAKAKKIATDAINDAKQAEAELSRAEAELAGLSAIEQHAAMHQIDALAQIAAEKSEIAVRESHKAKLAIKEAREAAELHSRAMDAAADAMAGEDEFAEFN